MAKKKLVRITKKLYEEICDKVSQDISVASLYRDDPDRYPRPETFSRYVARQSKEIQEKYLDARRIQISIIDDKYTELINNPPLCTGDKVADSHAYKVWQTQCSHMRDRIARLGPIFNQKYNPVQKQEVKHENPPVIKVASFIEPDLPSKEDKDEIH